jgi:hypothetical protein
MPISFLIAEDGYQLAGCSAFLDELTRKMRGDGGGGCFRHHPLALGGGNQSNRSSHSVSRRVGWLLLLFLLPPMLLRLDLLGKKRLRYFVPQQSKNMNALTGCDSSAISLKSRQQKCINTGCHLL